VLAAEGSKSLGGIAGKQAACTADPSGSLFPQRQMFAPGIEEIPFSIQIAAGGRRAYLLDKNAIVEPVAGLDVRWYFGSANRKPRVRN
jgi:hypothetical protein